MEGAMIVYEDNVQVDEVEESSLQGEALNEVINQWISKGREIHLRDVPYKLVQIIYHHFDFNEWKDLASSLGVQHMHELKVIDGDAYAHRKWCSEELLEYCASHLPLTFGDLINVLHNDLRRVYLLQSIYKSVEEFFKLREDPQYKTEYFRDVLNIPTTLIVALPNEHVSQQTSPRPQKRRALHSSRDVNQLQQNHSVTATIDIGRFAKQLEDKAYVEKFLNTKIEQEPKRVIILLSYSQDANELGKGFLETDFIATWEKYFQQSHFIVPVITQGYLNDINQPTDELQSRGVRFIYDLYTRRYVRDGCLNHYVRPLLLGDVNTRLLKGLNPTLELRWKLWDDWQQFIEMIDTLPKNRKSTFIRR
ncbi:hypothetical protein CHUAL_005323 [Chamberlinius hualienensis]